MPPPPPPGGGYTPGGGAQYASPRTDGLAMLSFQVQLTERPASVPIG